MSLKRKLPAVLLAGGVLGFVLGVVLLFRLGRRDDPSLAFGTIVAGCIAIIVGAAAHQATKGHSTVRSSGPPKPPPHRPPPRPSERRAVQARRAAPVAASKARDEAPTRKRSEDHLRGLELARAGDLEGAHRALLTAATGYNEAQDLASQVTVFLELAQLLRGALQLDAAEEAVRAAESVIQMQQEMEMSATQLGPHVAFPRIAPEEKAFLAAVRLSLRASIALLRAESAEGKEAQERYKEALFYAEPAQAAWHQLRQEPDRFCQAVVFAGTAALGLGELDRADETLTKLREILEEIGGPPIHLGRCYELLADLERRRGDEPAAEAWAAKAAEQNALPPYGEG